jgi:16S rRNA processing protein RimM
MRPFPPTTARAKLADYIVVGRIRRAHGVRGAWAVESVTDAPDAVFASGALLFAGDREGQLAAGDPQPLQVVDGRPMNADWLVRVAEITDRDVADSWRGRYLLADPASLPEAGDDEVYVGDLIGMAVDVEGEGPVGSIVDVYDAPQGYIVEIETATGRYLMPWHDDFVALVDDDARRVVITPPDGLFDG